MLWYGMMMDGWLAFSGILKQWEWNGVVEWLGGFRVSCSSCTCVRYLPGPLPYMGSKVQVFFCCGGEVYFSTGGLILCAECTWSSTYNPLSDRSPKYQSVPFMPLVREE